MLFVFLKHGVNHKRNHRTRIIFYQPIIFVVEGVRLFVKESFCCKTRQDLSINCDVIESFCQEITNQKSKNIILNLTCKPPNDDVIKYYHQMTF